MTAPRLVDLSTLLPGAYASRLLADAGWDVHKVSPPGGDPLEQLDPALFEMFTVDKRISTLDLKTAAGQSEFDVVCSEADVIIESYRPSAAEKLKVTPGRIWSVSNAAVISIRGYTLTMPADTPGHDINYMAASGAAHLTSLLNPSGEPVYWGMQVSNFAAGLMAAFRALALRGIQAHEVIGMDELLASWLEPRFLAQSDLDDVDLAGWVMPDGYGFYKTSDQVWLALGVREVKFRTALATALNLPEGWSDSDVANRIAGRVAADLLRTFRDQDVPCSKVLSMNETRAIWQSARKPDVAP